MSLHVQNLPLRETLRLMREEAERRSERIALQMQEVDSRRRRLWEWMDAQHERRDATPPAAPHAVSVGAPGQELSPASRG